MSQVEPHEDAPESIREPIVEARTRLEAYLTDEAVGGSQE